MRRGVDTLPAGDAVAGRRRLAEALEKGERTERNMVQAIDL
jgi:hypothetical protein